LPHQGHKQGSEVASTRRIYLSVAISALFSWIVLGFLWRNKIGTASVDVGWHYVLVDFFYARWGSFQDLASIHPTMAQYPPVAHIFAAAIGWLVGSPFGGMTCAAILFICTIYACLFEGIKGRDRHSTTRRFYVLTPIVFGLGWLHIVYGQEISKSFFLPQAAGQCIVLLTMLCLSNCKRSPWECVSVPALIFLLGWLYQFAQIQILSCAQALWLFTIVEAWRSDRRFSLNLVAYAGILGVLGCLAILFHPELAPMLSISTNNGDIIFARYPLIVIPASAIILMMLSLAIANEKFKADLRYPLFLPAVGLGISLAALFNYAAWILLDIGSPYAVRKHGFSLVTWIVVIWTVYLAQAISRQYGHHRLETSLHRWLPELVETALAVVLCVWLNLAHTMKDISAFKSYQDAVRLDGKLNKYPFGKVVSHNEWLDPHQNFFVTLVDLRVSDATAIKRSLLADRAADSIEFKISQKRPDNPQCLTATIDSGYLIKMSCVDSGNAK
jgi:hypothetical protein